MKKFKKIFLVSFLAFAIVFAVVFPAKGATIAELQAQLQILLAQIQTLQQQIAQMQGNNGVAWCHTFNANIGVGFKTGNPELDALKTALEKEGLYTKGTDSSKGYDETLSSAVSAFQEKYTSEVLTTYNLKRGTGYVGVKTRAKLNALYGCNQQVCTKLYSPVCGKDGKTYGNECTLKSAGVALDYTGECRKQCSVDSDCFALCPAADARVFCIVQKCVDGACKSSSSNLPPVISSVSGPTTLNVNQTGTWTISASDPENGTLTYSVVWGDEPTSSTLQQKAAAGTGIFTQTATFTHSYSTVGVYTIKFYVKDNAGNTASSSISVNISAQTTCIPIWTCGWGECKNGYQSQVPFDSNNCGLSLSSANIACPALAKVCASCQTINCFWDSCPGKHLPDINGCVNCSTTCSK